MEQLTKAQFEKCKKQFLALGELALTMNHYQLAMETTIEDPILWKMFLLDPRIADYINSEMNIIRTAGINEIIKQAPNSRSVGQAQLINALVKIDEAATNKDGPVFIYSYVPLNAEQKFAPNVMLQDIEEDEPEEEEEEIFINADNIPTKIPER
jgi:hypothetical protein